MLKIKCWRLALEHNLVWTPLVDLFMLLEIWDQYRTGKQGHYHCCCFLGERHLKVALTAPLSHMEWRGDRYLLGISTLQCFLDNRYHKHQYIGLLLSTNTWVVGDLPVPVIGCHGSVTRVYEAVIQDQAYRVQLQCHVNMPMSRTSRSLKQ